jgi:hypothetical protein
MKNKNFTEDNLSPAPACFCPQVPAFCEYRCRLSGVPHELRRTLPSPHPVRYTGPPSFQTASVEALDQTTLPLCQWVKCQGDWQRCDIREHRRQQESPQPSPPLS